MNARLVSAQAVHPEGEVQRPSEQDQESAAVFATEALSIQKYNELARVFGPTEVRLLTADTIIGTPLTRCAARRARRRPGSEASASRSQLLTLPQQVIGTMGGTARWRRPVPDFRKVQQDLGLWHMGALHANSTLESLETQEMHANFLSKYRPDTRALSLVSLVVADPLGTESTVERMCEHMLQERSGLLISAGKRKHN